MKNIPQAIDAEQSVLGAMMIRPDRIEEVLDRLSEDDFLHPGHRYIFSAIKALSRHGQQCDPVTMAEWLERHRLAEKAGGANYVLMLSNSATGSNISAYADIVRDRSVRRQIMDAAEALIETAAGSLTSKADDILSEAIASLMRLQKHDVQSEFTLKQAMNDALEKARKTKLSGKMPGISTGLQKLDQVLGGFHDSDFLVIGARPSHGKTALLLNFALSSDVSTGIISSEQPADQMGARVMSIDSHVNCSLLRNGKFDDEDFRRLAQSIQKLSARSCLIYDRPQPTIADVQRVARKWKHQHDIRLLFVDYIQRIEGTDRRAPKHERVAEVCCGLKSTARDLGIPVVALAQVSRDVETRKDKRPGMSDLSDSSQIEKEADQILTLYREGVYNPESPDAGIAEISVEKNRHGPTGFVKVAWLPESMRFENLAYAA